MRILPCLAVTASLALLGGVSCSPAESGTPEAMTKAPLAVEPAFLDLGSVTYGQRVSGIYRLRNTDSEPLVIRRIGPFSCQCISAKLVLPMRGDGRSSRRLDGKRMDLRLAPGESMEIHFTLDTARYRKPASRKIGSIPVVFQEHAGVVLEWGADIWTPFAVEPWSIDFQQVGVRERPSGTALVVAHDSIDFGLDIDLVDEEGWTVQSRQVMVPGGRLTYQLTFTAPEVLPEGPFLKEFRLLTDLPQAPPVRVTVMGMAFPDLSFSPTRLVFDPSRGRLSAVLLIVQRAVGADLEDLDLSQLQAAGVEITSQEKSDPQHLLLHLRYVGEVEDAGRTFRLEIPTADPSTPLLEIPVSVMPRRGDS